MAKTIIKAFTDAGNVSISAADLDLSGQLQLEDGTVAAPSLAFSLDTNTGLYRQGTDILGLVTGGVDRLTINAGGNITINEDGLNADFRVESANDPNAIKVDANVDKVGVGVAGVPQSKLHVIADPVTSGIYNINSAVTFEKNTASWVSILTSNAGASVVAFADAGSATSGLLVYDHADDSFRIDVNDTEALRITANGSISMIAAHVDFTPYKMQSLAAGNYAITGNESIYIMIDADNSQTNRSFIVETNSPNPGAGTECFRVSEAGNLTYPGGLVGKTNGSVAAAGHVGEYVASTITTATNAAASGTYKALTSLNLTAGDWIISAQVCRLNSSSTPTASVNTTIAVSTTAASSAGTTENVNASTEVCEDAVAWYGANGRSVHQVSFHVSISVADIYYLNVFTQFAAGTPQWRGQLRAQRIR